MTRTIPVIQDGTYQGSAVTAGTALVRAFTGPSHAVVTDPLYGADPTGSRDSTAAIQAAIDAVWAQGTGRGSVEIPGGVYLVSAPFLQLRPEVTIFGHGDGSVIVAAGAAPAEKVGVFHNGSYATASTGAGQFRFGLRDLWIKAQLPGEQHYDAITNVCGVVLHTDLDGHESDPDSVSQMRGLTIWDMHHGLVIFGKDDQGGKFTDIRVRGGQEAPVIVGKPVGHPLRTIASVSPGAADNKFVNLDVSSGNKAGGKAAGVEVWTSNCKFTSSTSWYNKRYASYTAPVSDRDALRDGAGWFISGTKNLFTACTAQENGGAGFVVVYPGNVLTGCIAESSSYADSVKGTAAVNEGDGFYVCNGASDTQLIGCRSGNARGAAKGQGYGYRIESSAKAVTVLGTGAQNATGDVALGSNLGSDVVVRVGSTLLNWTPTTASSALVEPLAPGQLAGLAQDWDFSTLTPGAPVATITSTTGTGDLTQTDTGKQPAGAALGRSRGARFVRSESDALTLTALPTGMTAATGYTVAWVGAINANAAATQYLLAAVGGGAKNAVSVGLTDKLEARAVSTAAGGSSTGLVAQTTGANLALYTVTTIVLRVAAGVMTLWAGDAKATFDAASDTAVTRAAADLQGKLGVGAYSDGTNTTSATVGEVAIFSRALTDDEVAGLRQALARKWG